MEIFQNVMLCVSLTALALLSVATLISAISMFVKSIAHKKEMKKLDEVFEEVIKAIIEDAKNENANKDETKVDDSEEVKVTPNYDSMTVAELKKIAQSKKIPGYYTLKRDELISTLKQNQ